MNLSLLAEAAAELYDAASYYEGKQEGLGRRLEVELHQYIAWILQNPEVPRLRRKKYRRVNLRPYYIAYVIRNQQIQVIAFAHGNQKPEYWIDRDR